MNRAPGAVDPSPAEARTGHARLVPQLARPAVGPTAHKHPPVRSRFLHRCWSRGEGLCYNPKGDRFGGCVIEIFFRERRLQRDCEDPKLLSRRFGQFATPLRRRLAQLRAAEVLADVVLGNPHPLRGNRAGQFAVTITQNYRLIFELADDPLPLLDDGTVDIAQVSAIRILEVGDYHG